MAKAVMWCYVIVPNDMQCCVLSCDVIQCYVMRCYMHAQSTTVNLKAEDQSDVFVSFFVTIGPWLLLELVQLVAASWRESIVEK